MYSQAQRRPCGEGGSEIIGQVLHGQNYDTVDALLSCSCPHPSDIHLVRPLTPAAKESDIGVSHREHIPRTARPPTIRPGGWTSVLDLLRRPERYEATTYAGVSIERVQAVADAVGLKITEELTYPGGNSAEHDRVHESIGRSTGSPRVLVSDVTRSAVHMPIVGPRSGRLSPRSVSRKGRIPESSGGMSSGRCSCRTLRSSRAMASARAARVFPVATGGVFEVIGPCSQFRWPWQLQFANEFRAVRDVLLDGVQDGERVEPDGGGEAFGLPVPFGFGEPGDDRGGFLQGVEPFLDAPAAGA